LFSLALEVKIDGEYWGTFQDDTQLNEEPPLAEPGGLGPTSAEHPKIQPPKVANRCS